MLRALTGSAPRPDWLWPHCQCMPRLKLAHVHPLRRRLPLGARRCQAGRSRRRSAAAPTTGWLGRCARCFAPTHVASLTNAPAPRTRPRPHAPAAIARTISRTLLPSRCASRPSASISARATAAATTTAATVTASLASLEWTARYSPCARLVQHESLRGRGGARWCCTQGMRRGAARGGRRSTCTSYLSTRPSSCS